jgi:hypothetical protein
MFMIVPINNDDLDIGVVARKFSLIITHNFPRLLFVAACAVQEFTPDIIYNALAVTQL